MESYIPADSLKPFVKTFLVIESTRATVNKLLPDTSIVLAFRLGGKITDESAGNDRRLPASVITGLRRSPRFLSYADKTACLLVIFKEGGAAAIFKEPLHELFSKSVPLDDLVPRSQLQLIEEQMNAARDNKKRVAIAERFLLSGLHSGQPDMLVNRAMQKIKLVNGNIKVRGLAGDMAISLDAFEKRFRRVAGISPKQFADTVRMRHLIGQLSAPESLTRIALDAGYFDQAHFNKDFRSFTGVAPQQFFHASAWW
ncbi:helix-turn-helix domain-containing protein [Mucilaginibacter ginsenosidivorans]|uniref:Helix-turn-helix domain-containing protein n=1 Tax=Mucilaginibacter ginsenosidivorans TaxID=398053 RepID=A0A5B8V2J5_9SPHI|nr:helix-turn-helix domain-containing protein [Mucilaginibacter ginsenosidivorans]